MTDQHRRDELAQLRAELAAQRAEVTALRARIDRPRRHFPRRFLPLAIVTLLVALLPLSLLAAGPVFSDLPTAAPEHQPNIQAIGDAGITTGFANPNDPNTRLYNPKDNVTREEMASFLARTAGLGDNPAVANAAKLGGYAPGGLVRVGRGPAGAQGKLLTNDYATINEVTLQIPAAGYVLVTGTVTVVVTNLTPSNTQMSLVTTAPGGSSPLITARTGTATGAVDSLPLTQSWVFAAPAAGSRTFSMKVLNTAGQGQVFSSSITALYVPFGPDGTTTAALP